MLMKIGELAKKAGVNIQTIRFYEREQIIPAPRRTAAGYRAYAEHDLNRVAFVKVCQHIGFTLTEIKQLMGLHDLMTNVRHGDKKPLAEICHMAQKRLHIIDEKIAAMQTMRQNLIDFLNDPAECPSARVPIK